MRSRIREKTGRGRREGWTQWLSPSVAYAQMNQKVLWEFVWIFTEIIARMQFFLYKFRYLQKHSHSLYVFLQIIFHVHFGKFQTSQSWFRWCPVSHGLRFFHVDKMEWINFLCTCLREGRCKLAILGSVSTMVYKLLQGEKRQFSSAVIVSPGALKVGSEGEVWPEVNLRRLS